VLGAERVELAAARVREREVDAAVVARASSPAGLRALGELAGRVVADEQRLGDGADRQPVPVALAAAAAGAARR